MTKKTFFGSSFVLFAAGLTMTAASCTNEDENSVTPDEKGLIPVEIRSGINGGRTELDGDGKTVEFQENDSLAVWDGQGDQKIRRFGTSGNGNVAIFNGNIDPDANVLNILYPLQDGATCNSGTITATIPTEQTAIAGTFDPSANLSVATADYVKGQNVTCTLENVCGLLKFTVPTGETYTKAVITGANGTEKIAGEVTIDAAESTPKATGGSATEITLKGTIEGGKNYYVALIPQEFTKGIKMQFYTGAEGKTNAGTATVTKSDGSGFEVKPGVILNAKEVKPENPTPAFGPYTVNTSTGEAVKFARGNLLCIRRNGEIWDVNTCEWKFAESYLYTFEKTGMSIGSEYANQDTISLFAWGTSGVNHGAVYYQPWCTYNSNSGFDAYGSSAKNLYDDTGMADWGKAHDTELGGNGWRSLKKEEWQCLLFERAKTGTTAANTAHFARATIKGKPGLLLIPDGVEKLSGNTAQIGDVQINSVDVTSCAFSVNSYDDSQWTTLEGAGCVFFPAAGKHFGTTIYEVNEICYYWTSTSGTQLLVSPSTVELTTGSWRCDGNAIRLVCPND